MHAVVTFPTAREVLSKLFRPIFSNLRRHNYKTVQETAFQFKVFDLLKFSCQISEVSDWTLYLFSTDRRICGRCHFSVKEQPYLQNSIEYCTAVCNMQFLDAFQFYKQILRADIRSVWFRDTNLLESVIFELIEQPFFKFNETYYENNTRYRNAVCKIRFLEPFQFQKQIFRVDTRFVWFGETTIQESVIFELIEEPFFRFNKT